MKTKKDESSSGQNKRASAAHVRTMLAAIGKLLFQEKKIDAIS